MPRFDCVVESPIQQSFRVQQVLGMFDVPQQETIKHEFKVDIPVEDIDWQIGLIVGPSGSGKTTIGKRLFPEAYFHERYEWPEEAALVDGFPSHLQGKEITQALSSVGFSSAPHWLKRFAHLSNGQKFRCELARLMLDDRELVIFDEFTSIVDRDAAKISCAAVAKTLRKRKKPKLIALSCHYDIVDWLDPDWVYDTASGEFTRRLLRQRPEIRLEIYKTKTSLAWPYFMGHHYLTKSINKTASSYVAFWNNTLVGFTSNIQHPGMKNAKRAHRTVILPDYQGIGIGNALTEWHGAYLKSLGIKYYSATGHPAFIHHRSNHPHWQMSREPGHRRRTRNTGMVIRGSGRLKVRAALHKTWSGSRITASFLYIGPSLENLPRAIKATSPEGPITLLQVQ